jgi:exo-beta-1,3-glucanase (GH17 family)
LKRALRFQEEQFISASKIRDFVSKINEISSDLNEGRFSRNSLDGLYDSFQRVYSDLQTLKSFHWKLVGNTPEETEEKLRAAIAGESFKKKKKPKPEA